MHRVHYKNHKLVDQMALTFVVKQLKPALRCVWPARIDALNHEFTLGQGVKIQATRTEGIRVEQLSLFGKRHAAWHRHATKYIALQMGNTPNEKHS